MLKFESFSLATLKMALPYIQKNTSLCSDHSLGAVFMWHSDDIRFCIWNDTFVIHQTVGGQKAFSWPVGADPHGMIDELKAYALQAHLPLRFYAVDESTLDVIRADERLSPATWSYDARWSDYIYSFEDAKAFGGRKFSGQRNHINKFKRLYGDPDITLLTPDDMTDLEAMLSEYEAEHSSANKMEKLELKHTVQLIECYAELGLIAACLRVDGRIVAFSIGEIVGDMLLIHVEKALRRCPGAYPTMYNGFVRLVSEISDRSLTIVNREDDSGDPGLRTSKMQYHPIGKVNKYLVHINSPISRLDKFPVISCGAVVATGMREDDKKNYLKLSTDVENNQYWGYDYREDVFITSHIDEDTFYEGAMYDMAVGDSINFAVRMCADGEMIGEAILWNFTADGSAELGCRLDPAYHGKGYGKAVFGAVADYAEHKLNLKVWARCYHQNEASYHMIISSGFKETHRDDTFCYFERNE